MATLTDGGWFGRHEKTLWWVGGVAVAAAIIGALAYVWLTGDTPPSAA